VVVVSVEREDLELERRGREEGGREARRQLFKLASVPWVPSSCLKAFSMSHNTLYTTTTGRSLPSQLSRPTVLALACNTSTGPASSSSSSLPAAHCCYTTLHYTTQQPHHLHYTKAAAAAPRSQQHDSITMTSVAELLPKTKKLAFELQGQVRQVFYAPPPSVSSFPPSTLPSVIRLHA